MIDSDKDIRFEYLLYYFHESPSYFRDNIIL